jgi:hypothetical protein
MKSHHWLAGIELRPGVVLPGGHMLRVGLLILSSLIMAACAGKPATVGVIRTTPTAAVATQSSEPLPTATIPPEQPTAVVEPTKPVSTHTPTAMPSVQANATPTETNAPEPTVTSTMAPTLAPSVTPTETATVPLSTPTTAPVSKPAPPQRSSLVIDHRAMDDFARIPDEYIAKAAQLRLLFRGASVGDNITNGLNCLANNFDGRRPAYCDSRLPPEQVFFDPKYNRNNWTFELHAPLPNPNPPWEEKAKFFIDRVDGLGAAAPYDIYSYTVDYIDVMDGSTIDDVFFGDQKRPFQVLMKDLEALEARHPDRKFFYWTSNLARAIGTPDSQSFNEQMRAHARANGEILFDMADIESHAPDGSSCTDNAGHGIPAICQDYTAEKNAGHLNALGAQRVSKAFWVLMARMAGWSG